MTEDRSVTIFPDTKTYLEFQDRFLKAISEDLNNPSMSNLEKIHEVTLLVTQMYLSFEENNVDQFEILYTKTINLLWDLSVSEKSAFEGKKVKSK